MLYMFAFHWSGEPSRFFKTKIVSRQTILVNIQMFCKYDKRQEIGHIRQNYIQRSASRVLSPESYC